jgi:uncharacterized membrane protein
MAPLIALVVVTLFARLAGVLKFLRGRFGTLSDALCPGVAALFLMTGGAHFIGLRDDMIRMVPPMFGNPGFWVTFTGVAEIAGAIGILIPATRKLAAAGLVVLLLAVFTANVYAATHQLTLAGAPATPLIPRIIEQLVFLAAVAWAGFGRRKRDKGAASGPKSTSALLEDITSGDATRVWSSSCEIIRLRDTSELDCLAANIPKVLRSTKDLELGGTFLPNAVHLKFALRKLEYYKSHAGCLCRLYREYQMYNPQEEAKDGHIRIDGITYIDGKWVDAYACTCTSCGTKFRVEERESHYTWWGWSVVPPER